VSFAGSDAAAAPPLPLFGFNVSGAMTESYFDSRLVPISAGSYLNAIRIRFATASSLVSAPGPNPLLSYCP
jgi:hypothetical protein